MERETSPVLGSILKYLAASSSVERISIHDSGATSEDSVLSQPLCKYEI